MKNYYGVIFDLDGVICFTDQFHYQAWLKLAQEEGIYFDRTINDRLRGVSRMGSLEIILERSKKIYTPDEKEEMTQRKNGYYRQYLEQMTPADLPEETLFTLQELRRRGYKLAIGSSSKNAGMILDRIGLGGFFDEISDGNGLAHSKPHPEVFLRAARLLNLEPQACLVVEDAQSGIQAASAGGFDSAALGDAWNAPQAVYRLSAFRELLALCPEQL